jgi:hypothetical protein
MSVGGDPMKLRCCCRLGILVKYNILSVIFLLMPIHVYSQATRPSEYRIVPADIDVITIVVQEDYGDLKVEERRKMTIYISKAVQIMLNRNGIKTTLANRKEISNYLRI